MFRVLSVVDDNGYVTWVINIENIGYMAVHCQGISLSEIVMHNPVLVWEDASLVQVALLMMGEQEDHVLF